MKNTYFLITLLLFVVNSTVRADAFFVNRFEDAPDKTPGNGVCDGENMVGNVCSFRAAIMEANFTPGSDTILLQHGGVYVLSHDGENENLAGSGDLDIVGEISIANLADGFVIDGNGTDRIFHVLDDAKLTITNGVLTNGVANSPNTFQGGAIKVEEEGVLIVDDVEFYDNVANRGGAIFSDGQVLIEDAYIHHNAVTNESEPVNLPSEGNALFNRELMIINTSTLSQNGSLLSNQQNITINTQEYAIHSNPNGINAVQPVTYIFNSTIANNIHGGVRSHRSIMSINQSTIANHDTRGLRFIRNENHPDEVQLIIKSSLFANNEFKDCNDVWAVPASELDVVGNFNASMDETCGFTGSDNLQNIENPFYGTLSHWGGKTQTLMLNVDSPVIDFVEENCSDDDQRGSERPLDGNNDAINGCDVGSLELDRTKDPIVSDVIFKNNFELIF